MSSVPPVAAPAVPFSLLEEEGDDVGTANGLANGWGGRSQGAGKQRSAAVRIILFMLI